MYSLKLTTKTKLTLSIFFSVVASFLFLAPASASITPDVTFAPSTNWQEWIVRYLNETGRGQTFKTGATTTAFRSVALKLCRVANFTKPKTLTLCTSAVNGYYGGCQTPIVSKTFSASDLNAMIHYDLNCPANLEGGPNDGTYYKWAYFTLDNAVTVSSSANYFFLLNGTSTADNEPTDVVETMYNNCNYLGASQDYTDGQTYSYHGSSRVADGSGALCDMLFKTYTSDPNPPVFAITSPLNNDPEIRDTWITVSGTCPIAGTNRIGLTNDCLGFNNINYNLACTAGKFSGQFYYDGLGDKRVIARDISSVSTDCANYDSLMDYKTVRTIEVINGYPNNWYFNFDYYSDYDIKIKSPTFDTALTLPYGSTSSLFTFQFIYPASSTLANLNFTIKQYDPNGNLLNASFATKTLSTMADTQNYSVNLDASSTTALHYVVQLTDTGAMKRQYPFGIYVSDLNFTANVDATNYLFPRLVEALKKKIVFNYFFAFHDGFAGLFNASTTAVTSTALDITFKSVSADKQYNTSIMIFSASDPNVKNLASGLRPYITAIMWLIFALYVVLRITHLFSGTNGEDK